MKLYDLPYYINIKEQWLKLNYYLGRFIKNGINFLPWFLFTVSILSSAVLIISPNFLHILLIYGESPMILELSGNVLMKSPNVNSSELNPLPGANIEIGGYYTVTDYLGYYHIKFVSKSIHNIPVLISINNNSIIKRVTFEQGLFKKEEMFILNGVQL